MGREVKTNIEIVEGEIVTEEREVEFDLQEVEVPGTRCDFCNQWFADHEEVEFTELYENPRVQGLPQNKMKLEGLLDLLYATEVVGRDMGEDLAGNEFVAGVRTTEIGSKVGLWMAMKQLIENGGGPSELRRRIFEASEGEEYDPRKLGDGDVIFYLQFEPRIEGDIRFMCQYCKEKHDE